MDTRPITDVQGGALFFFGFLMGMGYGVIIGCNRGMKIIIRKFRELRTNKR